MPSNVMRVVSAAYAHAEVQRTARSLSIVKEKKR